MEHTRRVVDCVERSAHLSRVPMEFPILSGITRVLIIHARRVLDLFLILLHNGTARSRD